MTDNRGELANAATDVDRRTCGRYLSGNSEIEFQVGSRTIRAKLHDQSLGGIGILVDQVQDIAFGQQVDVRLCDESAIGYVRSICRAPDGGYRLGISWNDYARVEGKRCKSAAHFIAFRDLQFVCELLFNDGPNKRVRLWDGAEFQVSPDQLCSQSAEARQSKLSANRACWATLAAAYGLHHGLHHGLTADDLLQTILDFEFSFADDAGSKTVSPPPAE